MICESSGTCTLHPEPRADSHCYPKPFSCYLEDIELNRDFKGDDYDYDDEAKLVIFPQHFEIPLPNIEELPALVSALAWVCTGTDSSLRF